jgi:UDP-N-acetylmuramate dehydrogenase
MGDLPEAERILADALGPGLRTSYPLAPLTTFRIGGPAALFVEADDEAALAAVASASAAAEVPVAVIGKGSNLLVSDAGFPGIVVRLGRGYRWAARDGDLVAAGAAMPLPALAGVALRHGLGGLEFGVAIPATLGGAVVMNAGAHDRSMSDVVERIDVYSFADHARRSIAGADAGFAYRRSSVPPGVIVGVALRLRAGEEPAIRAAMDGAREWRRRTQPLAEPNCGSVFTNPPGDYAARLIEAAGAKGLRVGAARVSEKHANFIVADPGASAADVWSLIERVRELVERSSGIRLETEVRVIGEVRGVRA